MNKVFLNLFSDSNEFGSDESINIGDSNMFLTNEVIHDSNEILQTMFDERNNTLLIKKRTIKE
jgi:hypothetical protein